MLDASAWDKNILALSIGNTHVALGGDGVHHSPSTGREYSDYFINILKGGDNFLSMPVF